MTITAEQCKMHKDMILMLHKTTKRMHKGMILMLHKTTMRMHKDMILMLDDEANSFKILI